MVRRAKFGWAITAFLIFLLSGTIVAIGASKTEIRQIIEFVQREGKQDKTPVEMLQGLGIQIPGVAPGAEGEISSISKAYRVGSFVHAFVIVKVNGRTEYLAERIRGDFYQGWRMNDRGTVSNTVQVDDAGKVIMHSGLLFESDLASVLANLERSANAGTKGN